MTIVRGGNLEKRAEFSAPEDKNISEMSKTATKGTRIANHAWSQDHVIDFENTSIIDKGGFRT